MTEVTELRRAIVQALFLAMLAGVWMGATGTWLACRALAVCPNTLAPRCT